MSTTPSDTSPEDGRVRRGQTWCCDEREVAKDLPGPWSRPHQAAGIEEYARFRAAVVDVLDGVAELQVSLGNGHPRTPSPGATLDIAVETLRDDARWTEVSNNNE